MKKQLVLIFTVVVMMFGMTAYAKYAAKHAEKVNLEVKVNYKSDTDSHAREHEMKNEIELSVNKWGMIGKIVSEKSDDVLLVLAKLLAHKNNEYTVQFLLIDSTKNNIFVVDPQMKVLAGLPSKMSVKDGTRNLNLDVLAVAVN